jgi:hypothetical protein
MLMNASRLHQDSTPLKITISGQTIAKSKWNAQTRARLAAQRRLGWASVEPTTKLAGGVFNVSIPLVNAAIAEIGPASADAEYESCFRAESLAAHFLRSTPAELLEAARAVGPAVVWDKMIAPIV